MDEDDFTGCLAGTLRAATRATTRRYDAALRPSGLRITQVAVLAQVRRLQPVSMSRIAAEIGAERSAVVRDLAVLERDGLVDVAGDEADRRRRLVSLTAAGTERLAAAAPAWRLAQAQMRDVLGDELAAALLDVARRVSAALDGPEGRTPPQAERS